VGIVSEGPNEGWIPRDVAIARNVFNAAAPRYRAALSHYRLEGFVTEHCDALLDVSSLHKALVGLALLTFLAFLASFVFISHRHTHFPRAFAVKTHPVDDIQYSPCNPSDTRE
jgi:hypothetical protein